jgi:hypothetical protein
MYLYFKHIIKLKKNKGYEKMNTYTIIIKDSKKFIFLPIAYFITNSTGVIRSERHFNNHHGSLHRRVMCGLVRY